MEQNKIRIAIVGRGNVASHLKRAICDCSHGLSFVGTVLRDTTELPEADIYVLAVSDDALGEVSTKLSAMLRADSLVVHTAGAQPLGVLSEKLSRRGVLYPFQTFSLGREVDMQQVPFFVEALSDSDTRLLFDVALLISRQVKISTEAERKALHLAGVYACNFVNHLFAISENILKSEGLSMDALKPLITECCSKALNADNISAMQTGPAVRGDIKTINEHKKMLYKKGGNFSEVYDCLTNSIMKNGKF